MENIYNEINVYLNHKRHKARQAEAGPSGMYATTAPARRRLPSRCIGAGAVRLRERWPVLALWWQGIHRHWGGAHTALSWSCGAFTIGGLQKRVVLSVRPTGQGDEGTGGWPGRVLVCDPPQPPPPPRVLKDSGAGSATPGRNTPPPTPGRNPPSDPRLDPPPQLPPPPKF